MCPDGETLSAYLDGEIPVRFESRLDEHVQGCADCRTKLSRLQSVTDVLRATGMDHEDVAQRQSRVYNRIAAAKVGRSRPDIWRRKLIVPIPAAAAAVVVALFFGMGAMYLITQGRDSGQTVATSTSIESGVSVDDLEALLAQLGGSTDVRHEVTLELPRESRFSIHGEPMLLKTAGTR
jgi:anti-sigma factor RsiW